MLFIKMATKAPKAKKSKKKIEKEEVEEKPFSYLVFTLSTCEYIFRFRKAPVSREYKMPEV